MCWVWVCGRVFLCTQAGLQLNYVAKAGFTFAAILLPLPPRWSARMLGVCLTGPSHVHVCGGSFSIWWLSANRSSCFSVVIFCICFLSLRQGLLLAGNFPGVLAPVCVSGARVLLTHYHTRHGCWGLNSGSHICTASTLWTEPSPQPSAPPLLSPIPAPPTL